MKLIFVCVFYFALTSIALGAIVEHVIIISIDGGKPDTIFAANMPNLERIVIEGSYSFSAKTIFPSKTLPSHVSMMTGVTPDVHKIVWNSWDQTRGPVTVPTIFQLATDFGFSTAFFGAKNKFKHIEVPNSLNKFSIEHLDAMDVATAAATYFSTNKTNLLFVHLPDADEAGHLEGWGSESQIKALQNVDDAIGLVKNAIEKTLNNKNFVLIITADHGGTELSHGSATAEDSTIPWITQGNNVRSNHLILKAINTMDTAATAMWLLGVPYPKYWTGVPIYEAFKINLHP